MSEYVAHRRHARIEVNLTGAVRRFALLGSSFCMAANGNAAFFFALRIAFPQDFMQAAFKITITKRTTE
jgi:hypothetical protein